MVEPRTTRNNAEENELPGAKSRFGSVRLSSVEFGLVQNGSEGENPKSQIPNLNRKGEGGGGQNKRQDVNTSVKPGDFVMYKCQIVCQELSGECQVVP
jgi:hypothetical protein